MSKHTKKAPTSPTMVDFMRPPTHPDMLHLLKRFRLWSWRWWNELVRLPAKPPSSCYLEPSSLMSIYLNIYLSNLIHLSTVVMTSKQKKTRLAQKKRNTSTSSSKLLGSFFGGDFLPFRLNALLSGSGSFCGSFQAGGGRQDLRAHPRVLPRGAGGRPLSSSGFVVLGEEESPPLESQKSLWYDSKIKQKTSCRLFGTPRPCFFVSSRYFFSAPQRPRGESPGAAEVRRDLRCRLRRLTGRGKAQGGCRGAKWRC